MKKLYTLMALIGLIAFSSTSIAQCANDNVQFGTSTAPTVVGTPVTLTTCLFGGEYRLVTGLVAGATYTFATCGNTAFDTQLTIFNATTGAVIGYNDDACGLQSSVTFVSTGVNVRVSLDQFNCTSNSTCMTLTATLVSGAGPANPCNSISPLTCTTTGSFSLTGNGLFTGNGPFSTPGAERIFSFTPTVSGAHTITVSHTGGGWVDLFSRTQASGCSGTGWTYIDDILGSATNTVTLTAGVPVYFMVDDEDALASNGTISVACPALINPCNTISTIAGCGGTGSFSLTGAGVYTGNGPFTTPGAERIFQFTTPAGLSGNYEIVVNHTGGFFVDLFFRTQASGCSGTGWTYISDISTTETNTVALAGGTTYYFMIDDEDLLASSGTITINCPCLPTTTPDGSFTYDGPFTISGNTIDECSDCDLRPSDDQIYAIEIPCAGTYTFSTCGGASWDTYLYLTTAFCGGTILAQNDDFSCSGGFATQSSVTATLSPGTYYIHVEGFSVTSEGAFNLSVSGTIPDIQLAISSSTNVSCFGGNDGSATAVALTGTAPFNFEWSDGQATATASGLVAGTYSVGGKDANNCSAAPVSVTITEPPLLETSATSTAILCNGGTSDVTVSATGGTEPYSGTGVFTVSAGTHSFTVTDANGCTSTVTITVTEPTLLTTSASSTAIACFGGTSDVTVVATGGTAPYTGDGVYTVTAGSYSYTVTDANGCTSTVSITVTEPTLLETSASSTAILCNGGTSDVTVVATGGTAPYTGDGVYTVTAGNYSYTVTDANGCTSTVSITVTEPTLLETSASSTAILCNGGTSDVTVVATGGTAPYTGDGVYTVTAGTYSYTVTDANGCTSTVSITVTEPTLLETSASSTAIACFGGTSDVTVVATGGTAPYSGDGVYTVTAGTYSYTVIDANGCTSTVSITVTEPTLLEASASSTAIACFGGTSDVTVVATGGTAPYSGDGVYTVTAGTYDYTVTDANGCTADVSITVDQPTLLEASASATPILCNGGTSDVTVVGTGGTPPYTGDGVYTVTAGTYSYTVTDANGCTADVSITIGEPTLLQVELSGCAIVYDGAGIEYACATINSSVSGGTPAYSLNWSPTNESTGSIIVCPDATTVYTVTAADANGCVATDSWTVTVVDLTCTPGGGSSNSGSSSGEVAASSGISYPSAPSCPSGSSANSGSSNSGKAASSGNSGSGNTSSVSCSLPSESSASCSNPSNGNGNNGNNCNNSGNSGNGNASVLMCLNGTTYCVKLNQVENKLACGFTFGPCDMQQTAACDNTPAPTASPSCVCSGGIATLNVRYIGPSNQDLAINAKSCGVSLGTVTNAMTGQTFTVSASNGGLSQLRNNTYFELVGSGFGQIEIPTNCCDNPIGQVFFPFEVIGWVDINGNSCGNNGNGGGGGGPQGIHTSTGGADKGSYLAENGAKMGQFPNPTEQVSNFEFSVGEVDNVTLTIVNINGQEIATIFTQEVEADRPYAVSFDVSELQSGIYYAHLKTSKGTLKNKFIVLK